jgi:hypothetical protein
MNNGSYLRKKNIKYLSPFTIPQLKRLEEKKPELPEVIIEDNTGNVVGNVVKPGALNFIKTINEFINDANRYKCPYDKKFKTYFAIEFLLTPCFFYWMAELDNVTDQSDPNGYEPNVSLLECIQRELLTVSWDGEKYVNNADSNADILRTYLTSIGVDNIKAEQYKGYPGHSVIVKGNEIYNGIDCLLIQNSWGGKWNANFCGSRPISRTVLDMVVYGVIKIQPDINGFEFKEKDKMAAGITKTRKLKSNKTNKTKKKMKSPKRGTRRRI